MGTCCHGKARPTSGLDRCGSNSATAKRARVHTNKALKFQQVFELFVDTPIVPSCPRKRPKNSNVRWVPPLRGIPNG